MTIRTIIKLKISFIFVFCKRCIIIIIIYITSYPSAHTPFDQLNAIILGPGGIVVDITIQKYLLKYLLASPLKSGHNRVLHFV